MYQGTWYPTTESNHAISLPFDTLQAASCNIPTVYIAGIDPKKTNQFHQCHGWIFQLRLVNSPHWYFQKIPPRAAKQTGMYSLAASSILPKARRKCSISLKNLPEASLVSQFLLTEWSGVYFQDLGVQKNGGVHNFPTYSPKSLCFFLFKQTLNAWVIPW